MIQLIQYSVEHIDQKIEKINERHLSMAVLLDLRSVFPDRSSFAVCRGYFPCGVNGRPVYSSIRRKMFAKSVEVYEQGSELSVKIRPPIPGPVDVPFVHIVRSFGFIDLILDVIQTPVIRIAKTFRVQFRANEIETVSHGAYDIQKIRLRDPF